jgi:hypothetical protein
LFISDVVDNKCDKEEEVPVGGNKSWKGGAIQSASGQALSYF